MRSAPISRRSLLIGGGVATGLLVAWSAWPRRYLPNVNVAPGETLFNAFLKVDRAGQIVVIVPQLEMGQGVTTVLPQILADELGADWRTVAVQPAPISPLYANSLLAAEDLDSDWLRLLGDAGQWAQREYAQRSALMLTGGSSSAAMFEDAYRDAGAAARVLLCKAAAARWDIGWEACDIQDGVITDGQRTLRIGELAGEAAAFALPEILPLRQGTEGRLIGQDVPRIDLPSKVDGATNFAADIRLPDMVFASIRQGPVGDARLISLNETAAAKVTGFLKLVRSDRWVAAVGTNWWAANKALDAADPLFRVDGALLDSDRIDSALETAFAGQAGRRLYQQGDLLPVFEGATIVASEYQVAPALHLTAETPAATARVLPDRAEIWMASQAPSLTRAAIADALGLPEAAVTLYPMQAGGSFGSRMAHDVGVQAALIARDIGRPVQLMWSRLEEIIADRPRPPARARMAAKLGRGGRIDGWLAKVAAPSALAENWARIAGGALPHDAMRAAADRADRRAVAGMVPAYAMGAFAIDHYPADIGLPTGRWRSNADHYAAFFNECFIDELARIAGIEPLSFRIQMLGDQPRLAHCLSTASALGGWQGGIAGSGQGLACHAMRGSFAAVMVEAALTDGRLSVGRIVAAVDCGEQVNPDIARQQIEGGLMFGLASAMGGAARYAKGMPVRGILGRLGLPRLADVGEITVEIIRSTARAGGIGEVAVPPVAPAIANALFTVTGQRLRTLPLLAGN
ncbi:xanthine dehydrogenase family protein molybdopterin-binding subunit [Sphingobium algorifonticola]|uniref:Xanthine dehydrogenase family protein molybdopterin-binding subunit n=2 Tax=Sphingobium algorifonticola TaxID=2008318 RepID=A0A437JEC6_9SPHN|nr:xanthine dehydrogenase family protein molybdopterin-binding subunit [Sphingobium algorifonticola]